MIAAILVTLAIIAEFFVALLAILFYNRNLDVCKVTLDSCKCSDLFRLEIGKCAWFLKSVDRHANLYIIIIINTTIILLLLLFCYYYYFYYYYYYYYYCYYYYHSKFITVL